MVLFIMIVSNIAGSGILENGTFRLLSALLTCWHTKYFYFFSNVSDIHVVSEEDSLIRDLEWHYVRLASFCYLFYHNILKLLAGNLLSM